jgi:glycerophosphoryl diester phosphodiesterase
MQPFYFIGHRGAAGEKFENSMIGFEYALSLDIDAIEFDIQLHRGELWVIHDHDLERLTGTTCRFDELDDPAALRLLNGEPVPKLSEVLDLFWGKIPVIIEIKSPGTGPALLALLDQYPTIEQATDFPWIIISSFDHRQILELRSQDCCWALAPIILGIPLNARQLIDDIKPYSFHLHNEYLDFGLIREIQQQGVRVMVFTVNKPDRAHELRKAGIDGIFTDYPSKLPGNK